MLFGRRLLSPFNERIGRKLLSGRASVVASGLGIINVGTFFVFIEHLLSCRSPGLPVLTAASVSGGRSTSWKIVVIIQQRLLF